MKRALAVLCMLVPFSLPLRAETTGTVDPQRCGPCCQDAKRLCSDIKSNDGKIKCLVEKDAQVSPECKRRRQARADEATIQSACEQDRALHCTSSQPLGDCLSRNRNKLSESCVSAVEQWGRNIRSKGY